MIGFSCKTNFHAGKVRRPVESATQRYLGRAGAVVRKTARRSIRKARIGQDGRPVPSAPGTPPRTRRGLLRNAILFGVDRVAGHVVIGPTKSRVGLSGSAHEFGGRYRRNTYAERPFMGPALQKITPSLPAMWADSVR